MVLEEAVTIDRDVLDQRLDFDAEAVVNLISSERLTDWTWGAALVTLAALACFVLVPSGFLWTATVLAMGLGGVILATAAVVRSRRAPTLGAQVIASSHAAPAIGPVSPRSGAASLGSRNGTNP